MRFLARRSPLFAFGAALTVSWSPAFAQQTERASAYSEVAQWPDWSGVWSPGASAAARTTPTPPVLTPAAQLTMAEFEAAKARGENL